MHNAQFNKNTVAEAKIFLRENWEEGINCPCCGQLVRKWRHSINSSIARTLIKMLLVETKTGNRWVHIMNQIGITTMYSIATYWDLIEPLEYPKIDSLLDDKKSSGMWFLTEKGKLFVKGFITIPKYVNVFDHKLVGTEGKEVFIQDCLGKKFSYNELMKGF